MTAAAVADRTGKYLTFYLGEAQYAVNAMQIVGIITMQDITPLPQSPDFVRGLTNVRGKVVPVISARLRLGMPDVDDAATSCIVMLLVGATQTGVVVDAVCDVVDINENQIEPPPVASEGEEIVGLAKLEKRIITVLQLEKVFGVGN